MALLRLIKASARGLNIISSPCHFLRTTEPKRRIADVYRDQERSRRGSKAARRGRRGSDSEPARPGPGEEQSNILHYTKRNHVSQPFGLRNTGEGVQTSCWNNRRTRLFLRLSWSSGRARKEDAGAGALTLGTGRSEEHRPHAGSRMRLCMARRRLL
jgi:hypothetical protein